MNLKRLDGGRVGASPDGAYIHSSDLRVDDIYIYGASDNFSFKSGTIVRVIGVCDGHEHTGLTHAVTVSPLTKPEATRGVWVGTLCPMPDVKASE